MKDIDEHLERLMTRKLDGELTPEESLEFDRLLLKNPSAGQHFEELSRIDSLAADLIQRVSDSQFSRTATVQPISRRRLRWVWIGTVPAAAAACLALWITWSSVTSQLTGPGLSKEEPPAQNNSAPAIMVDRNLLRKDPDARLADWGDQAPYQLPYRSIDTRVDYYGVFDEASEKLYLLEVQSVETQQRYQHRRRPLPQGKVIFASGNM